MLRAMSFAVLAIAFGPIASAVELKVTVSVTAVNPGGFVEFKAESDQKGERATGHLNSVGDALTICWKMGDAKQNIWFWWDNLNGEADLTIEMTGAPGKPVTLFKAHCAHQGNGEVQVGKTIVGTLVPGVNHFRLHQGIGPFLSPNKNGSNTHIKNCDEVPTEVPADHKGGAEWDLIWE
jgi:hypothetical protein